MKKFILLSTVLFYYLPFIYSQAGQQDSSFHNSGIVINDFDGTEINSSEGRHILPLPNGSMYIIFETRGSTIVSKRDVNGVIVRSYGNNGFSESVSGRNAHAALQPDGKIVVICSTSGYHSDFVVFRYNSNGSIDKTFNKNVTDFASGNDYASSIAIQKDGKIVAAGTSYTDTGANFAIARYNDDGSLDSSFSKDGLQITSFTKSYNYGNSVAIQNDGKIVVAGHAQVNEGNEYHYLAAVARYDLDGTLDNTFSNDGKQTKENVDSKGNFSNFMVNAVTIQQDGKIILAGSSIIRFNSDGTTDETFGNNGKVANAFGTLAGSAFALAIQTNGKIVVSGSAKAGRTVDFVVARYEADGSLDDNFSGDGIQTRDFDGKNDYVFSMALLTNGKLLVAGTNGDCEGDNCSNKFAAVRYNMNGTADNTFDNDGQLTGGYPRGATSYLGMAVQQDGKAIIIGTSNNKNFIARYNLQGSLDSTFNENGIVYTAATNTSVAIQADQKILVASTGLARYNSDGTQDNTFGNKGNVTIDLRISALTIQKDGKIVAVGSVDNSDSYTYFDIAVARYNVNGSPDSSFSSDGKQTNDFGQDEAATSVALQSDGTIVVGVTSSNFRGAGGTLVSYTKNGSLNFSITITQAGGLSDGGVNAVAIQKDDKIVVLANKNGSTTVYRYTASGILDTGFSEDGQLSVDFAQCLTIENDEKIIVAGGNFALARYNANGNLDSTFGNGGLEITSLDDGSGLIRSLGTFENKLYAAGTLTKAAGNELVGTFGVLARYLLDGIGTAPTVSLTTPTNNTTRLAPANIKLTAAASEANATISKVEFYKGTTLLHTETVTPYGFKWTDVPVGNYTLTAKAYDNTGLVTISAPVHISVVPNKPPIVSIIKPVVEQTVAAPGYIHFEAAAEDVDGRIARVEFYKGSTLIRTEYYPPYTYVWKNVPIGNYTITAVAIDNWAARTTSAPVTIRVVNPPVTVANKPFPEDEKTDVSGVTTLNVSPNPANDILTIYATGFQREKKVTISVLSSSGTIMKTAQSNSSFKTIQLDVSKFTSGVYTLKMISGTEVAYRQFLKL